MAIEFVNEMDPLLGDKENKVTDIGSAETLFREKLPEIKKRLEEEVTSEKLVEISRYAKNKMESFTLPAGWVDTLEFVPLAVEDGVVIFGNKTRSGVPLPSHSPIVFRKLVTRVHVSIADNAVTKVIVTIRGWCEE